MKFAVVLWMLICAVGYPVEVHPELASNIFRPSTRAEFLQALLPLPPVDTPHKSTPTSPDLDLVSVAELKASAARGDSAAELALSKIYILGKNGVTADFSEALKWFRKGADHGSAEAQFALGVMNLRGLGTPADDSEAVKWMNKAAQQQYPDAQYNMGMFYFNGQGVEMDLARASEWVLRHGCKSQG